MLLTKSQGHRHSGSGDDFKGFTIYGHVGHLGHVTNLSPLIISSLYMKFEFNWSSGF